MSKPDFIGNTSLSHLTDRPIEFYTLAILALYKWGHFERAKPPASLMIWKYVLKKDLDLS